MYVRQRDRELGVGGRRKEESVSHAWYIDKYIIPLTLKAEYCAWVNNKQENNKTGTKYNK